MRLRTPARPSSASKPIVMRLSMTGVINPNTRKEEASIPDIEFHVNPKNLSMNYTKNISRSRTRGGFVEEHFGDELDTLQVDASTGSFFSTNKGLTILHRNKTFSYINFQEILSLYKNNACYYQNGVVVSQGYIVLKWDTYNFEGQFSNFDWQEDANMPFNFNFSFTFEVHRTTVDV